MIVSLSPRAMKDMKALDPAVRLRVVRKIEDIEQNRVNPEPLIGDMAGLWKVYVGLRWRILIVKVAPRREVY